jgi:hypothetical protein
MRIVRSIARTAATVAAAAAVVVLAVVAGGGSGVSTATAGLDGSCAASASFRSTGLIVDARSDDILTVARSDTVDWQAAVESAPGTYRGSIWLELPPPFGRVEIDSWSGTTSTRATSGTEQYTLPKAVPARARFTLGGEHVDDHGTCTGELSLRLAGNPFTSPITWIGLGGTAASGVGLVSVLRPVFARVIRQEGLG